MQKMRDIFAKGILLVVVCGCTAAVGGEPYTSERPDGKGDRTVDPDAGPSTDLEADNHNGTDSAPACAGTEVDVEIEYLKRPADIVWVIDSSGSMNNEAALVQQHMNDFAARFSDASVDAQIIVITPAGFVSVPPPLGTDSSRFFQVSRSVSSSAALQALVDSWSIYSARLRENSVVHFIAVTDDESRLRGDCFVEQMKTLVGPQRQFKLHTISSEAASPAEIQPSGGQLSCAENNTALKSSAQACEGAASPGLEYRKAAEATEGLVISICTPDWSSVFDQLAGTVEKVSVLGCDFEMPEPPPGAVLQADKVELLAEVEGTQRTLSRVTSEAGCNGGDWYYDNPDRPTSVQLCPNTCDELGNVGAQLSLELGCAWSVR